MTRKWTVLPLLLLLPLRLYAQSFWDGDATIQRGDAAFESGSFAASNSFAQGTQVVVQDLDTGKSATVTVSSRIPDQSSLLVALSPEAAQDLGIQSGSIARVRVTLASAPDTSGNETSDQILSRDPDVNPGAAYAPATDQGAGAQAGATPDQTQAASSDQTETQAAANGQTSQAGSQAGQTQAKDQASQAGSLTDDQQIIAEAEARTPQKDLFLPPREDQKFALQPGEAGAQTAQAGTGPETQQAGGKPEIASVTPESAAGAGQPSEQGAGTNQVPTQPGVASVSSEAPSAPSPAPATGEQLAEAAPPAQGSAPAPVDIEGEPQQPTATAPQGGELASPQPLQEAAVPASPVQTEVSSAVASPPAGEGQTPSLVSPEAPGTSAQAGGAPGPAAASAPSATGSVAASLPAATSLPATSTLPSTAVRAGDRYFLQLAAFATEKPARDLEARLSPTYPILVMAPAATGPATFRVLLGPLNRAESGAILIWFRDRGFRDAFLRQE